MLERALDESNRFVDVFLRDFSAETHLGVRLRETDHGLELSRRGGYAALGGADVLAEFAHGDVGGYEGVGGGLGDDGVDRGAGVGDVGGEEFDGLR